MVAMVRSDPVIVIVMQYARVDIPRQRHVCGSFVDDLSSRTRGQEQ